jgi:hypothetical protein
VIWIRDLTSDIVCSSLYNFAGKFCLKTFWRNKRKTL